MKLPKFAIILVLLGAAASVGLAAGRHSSGEPTPAQVASLVRSLDDNHFIMRERAENSLRELGTRAVPLLRKELQTATSLETRRRLENVIADLSRIPWRRDLDKAVAEARRSGKPLLVFSTLGEVDGFA